MKQPLWHEIVKVVRCVDCATGNNLLLSVLNHKLKEFGVMTSILIDSKNKSIAIEVELLIGPLLYRHWRSFRSC